MVRATQWITGGLFWTAIASIATFFIEQGTEPAGDAVMWALYGVATLSAIIGVAVTIGSRASTRRSSLDTPSASRWGGEPRNAVELRDWLDVRVEELVAWRSVIDDEIAKPVPNIDRTDNVQFMFWQHMNGDVARKLQLLAPEWADYWGETPSWFYPPLVRLTAEQLADVSRFLGWAAERLRHIKSQLPLEVGRAA